MAQSRCRKLPLRPLDTDYVIAAAVEATGLARDAALRDAAANPAHPALAPFPRRRESIVASATSSPTGVIPAHAGIQWRGVRSEARRSLRIAVRFADRVSSGLRPAEQGGL